MRSVPGPSDTLTNSPSRRVACWLLALLFAAVLPAQETEPGLDRLCKFITIGRGNLDGLAQPKVRDDVTIDVMFLFSNDAYEQEFHEGPLDGAMKEVNDIYRLTGITFNTVGVHVMDSRSVAADMARGVEGNHLRYRDADNMKLLKTVRRDPEVVRLRDAAGADIVVAWTTRHEAANTIWARTYTPRSVKAFTPDNGYALLHVNADDPLLGAILGHVFGHNLGLAHEPRVEGVAERYRAIMSHTGAWVADYNE